MSERVAGGLHPHGATVQPSTGRVNGFETTWFSIYCSDSTPSTR